MSLPLVQFQVAQFTETILQEPLQLKDGDQLDGLSLEKFTALPHGDSLYFKFPINDVFCFFFGVVRKFI